MPTLYKKIVSRTCKLVWKLYLHLNFKTEYPWLVGKYLVSLQFLILKCIIHYNFTYTFSSFPTSGYQRYMTCARNTEEKKCGKAAVDFMQLLLRNAVSRLPEIVCTGYGSENHECHTLLPPPGTPPQGSKSDSVLSRLFAAYLGN